MAVVPLYEESPLWLYTWAVFVPASVVTVFLFGFIEFMAEYANSVGSDAHIFLSEDMASTKVCGMVSCSPFCRSREGRPRRSVLSRLVLSSGFWLKGRRFAEVILMSWCLQNGSLARLIKGGCSLFGKG